MSTATLGSSLGTGGMETKLIAAEIATAAGVMTVICSSRNPRSITEIIAYHTAREYPASFPRSLPTDPNCRLWASKTQVVSRNTQCMRDCTLSATRRHCGFGQQAHGIRRNTRRLLECWSNHVSHAVVSVLGISKIFLRSHVYQWKTSL